MRKALFLQLLPFLILVSTFSAVAQIRYENIIQVNGVAMTADSLRGVPNVTISVKHQDRGTISSPLGVFSLVCFKGDTLNFSALGFKNKEVIISENQEGNFISMIQLMVQDTFYLPETIIHALPSRENFNYVFQNWRVPDDKYETARKNTNAATVRLLSLTLSRDGRESQAYYQGRQAYEAAYWGQQQPMNIFSPLKWGEFIQAWKRGDFRKKTTTQTY